MHRECQNPSPTSRAVLGILVRQAHLPLLSCSSWLTLILLSQTPVLIPEDFNIQVVEPSTAPPNDSTLGVAACSYSVTCCAPCTTPASCQAHLLQSPPMYRAPSLWHADSTSLLTDQPRPSHLPLYWPFETTHTPWPIYCICSLAHIL